MTLCAAVYDPPHRADRSDTHTCDLKNEHDGPHHCDICGTWWTARIDVPYTPEARDARASVIRREVALARKDADLTGVGWVMIVRSGDGSYRYEHLSPERVVLHSERAEVEGEGPTLAEQVWRLIEEADAPVKSTDVHGVPGRRGWVHTAVLKRLVDRPEAGEAEEAEDVGDGAEETDEQEMERR